MANAQEGADQQSHNVIPIGSAQRRRTEPLASDEELIEYRRIRPQLLAMLADWPTLLREHRVVTTRCKLAKMLIEEDKQGQ